MVFKGKRRFAARTGRAVIAGFACLLITPNAGRAQSAVETWNQELLKITQQNSGFLLAGPPDVAMQMAILDNAMYDAVNVTSGKNYQPFAYSAPAAVGASASAAALTAGYQALYGIYNSSTWTNASTNPGAGRVAAITGTGGILDQITATYDTAMAALGSGQSITDGMTAGTAAAAATLAMLNGTGPGSANYAMINGLTPQTPAGSGTVPGVYVPPTTRPEMYPIWGTVNPVGVSSAQIQAATALVSLPGVTDTSVSAAAQVQQAIASSAYAANLLQTECAGSGAALSTAVVAACEAANAATNSTLYSPQTLAQNQAALFWNDPGTTFQPPGHWLQIADTAIAGLDLMKQAQVSAAMSTAITDAGIAAWGVKYTYNLWRPTTAIRDCNTTSGYSWNSTLTAGSCDTNWVSLIATPPHPDYVAGHPAFSGAAATVLTDLLGGNIGFSSTSNSYCNGGTPGYAGDNITIISCTLTTDQAAASGVYSAGTYTTCNSITLATGATNVNDSPLICPITFDFSNFLAASQGPLGSEFSRVVGGIHTPAAVADALTIGNAIGGAVFASNFQQVPEPSTMLVLATAGIGLLGAVRRRGR